MLHTKDDVKQKEQATHQNSRVSWKSSPWRGFSRSTVFSDLKICLCVDEKAEPKHCCVYGQALKQHLIPLHFHCLLSPRWNPLFVQGVPFTCLWSGKKGDVAPFINVCVCVLRDSSPLSVNEPMMNTLHIQTDSATLITDTIFISLFAVTGNGLL